MSSWWLARPPARGVRVARAAVALLAVTVLAGCAPTHPTPTVHRTSEHPTSAPSSASSPSPSVVPSAAPTAAAGAPAQPFLQLRAVFRAGAATATVVETVSSPSASVPAGWSSGFANCATATASSASYLHVHAVATVVGTWPSSGVLDVGAFTLTPRTVWTGALQPMQSYCTDVVGTAPFDESGDVMVDAAKAVGDGDQWGGAAWYLDVADGVVGVALDSCQVTLSPSAAALSPRLHGGVTAGSTRCGADVVGT